MPWKYIWIRYFGTKASIIMNFTSLPDRFVMNDTADGFVNCSLNAILKAVMKDSSVNMYSLTGLFTVSSAGLSTGFQRRTRRSTARLSDILMCLLIIFI